MFSRRSSSSHRRPRNACFHNFYLGRIASVVVDSTTKNDYVRSLLSNDDAWVSDGYFLEGGSCPWHCGGVSYEAGATSLLLRQRNPCTNHALTLQRRNSSPGNCTNYALRLSVASQISTSTPAFRPIALRPGNFSVTFERQTRLCIRLICDSTQLRSFLLPQNGSYLSPTLQIRSINFGPSKGQPGRARGSRELWRRTL